MSIAIHNRAVALCADAVRARPSVAAAVKIRNLSLFFCFMVMVLFGYAP